MTVSKMRTVLHNRNENLRFLQPQTISIQILSPASSIIRLILKNPVF